MKKSNLNSTGPLSGIRVIDLSTLFPGPLCSQHLADMGATVIKIENPRTGDLTRHWGDKIGGEKGKTSIFLMLNRNKKSVTINIKRESGREVLMKLLENADILLEGFRPDTMEKLGIGWSTLEKKFPRLIYCAISGFGATGPDKGMAGHDANFIARAGLLGITGYKDSPPVIPGFQVGDVGGGSLVSLSGILAALYSREKTGKGQFVDVSMLDGAFSFMHLYASEFSATKKNPIRGNGMLSGKLPNYNVYETKDNRHVMFAALEERFFNTFLKTINKTSLLKEHPLVEENTKILKEKMTQIFKEKTFAQWQPWFSHPDCCLSPVSTLEEVFCDTQLMERGMLTEMPIENGNTFTTIGTPFKFSHTPALAQGLAPNLGEHTDEILSELGYNDDELSELRKSRAI